MKHFVIDIETMGLGQRSALLSVGLVVVDGDEPRELLHYIVDTTNQDREHCSETLAWWDSQSLEARDASFGTAHGTTPILALGNAILKEAFNEPFTVWGDPAWFDVGILKDYAEQEELTELPWDYRQVCDVHTLEKLYLWSTGLRYTVLPLIPHHPVSDAKAAARSLSYLLRHFSALPPVTLK